MFQEILNHLVELFEDLFKKYGVYFKILLGCSLIFANEINLTDFNHVSVDGSIKKADNNRFNVIHKDDIEILIKYYEGDYLSAEELNKLRKPAKRFIVKEDIGCKEKIELLYEMNTQLTMSGQDTIPVITIRTAIIFRIGLPRYFEIILGIVDPSFLKYMNPEKKS